MIRTKTGTLVTEWLYSASCSPSRLHLYDREDWKLLEVTLTAPAVSEEKLQALVKLDQDLGEVLHKDPKEALDRARTLVPSAILDKDDIAGVKACILIDAGHDLGDLEAVAEGVKIVRRLREVRPDVLTYGYNLANGLTALSAVEPTEDPSRYLETMATRREARALFQEIVDGSAGAAFGARELAARAKTNQANLLKDSFRWLEAYEGYMTAVALDPANPVASTGAAKILQWIAARGMGPREHLLGLASRLAKLGRAAAEAAGRFDGEYGEKIFAGLDGIEGAPIEMDLSQADSYTRFVASHSLALSPTVEGLHPSVERWDCLQIRSIRQELADTTARPPLIYGMFNVLKADYLAARWIAYQALEGAPPESARYTDTLDYANYGIRSSLLTLAQRAAIDVLDRVAVAATEYLKLGPAPSGQRIYFWNRWHLDPRAGQLMWQPEIEMEISDGNLALVALAELAEDFGKQHGFLWSKKDARNASTHRFTILHEIGEEGGRPSDYVLHQNADAFEMEAVDSMQVARAAIFYLYEVIAAREGRLEREGRPTFPMFVPWHDWMRGEGLEDSEDPDRTGAVT